MRTTTLLIGLTLVASVALAGCTSSDDGEMDGELVEMKNFAFDPKTITVSAGTKIVWKNLDSSAHTVTDDNDTFDSGNVRNGGTFEWTFDEPGTYTYHCVPHATKNDDGSYEGMIGTVIVTA